MPRLDRRIREEWFAKCKIVVTLLGKTTFQQQSPLANTHASNKAANADAIYA